MIAVLDVVLLAITLVLVFLIITGYDQYFALRTKMKISSKYTSTKADVADVESVSTQTNMVKIKKVKASKVGNYLIITLVLSEQGSGDKISIDDPALLLPLVQVSAAEEKEENLI